MAVDQTFMLTDDPELLAGFEGNSASSLLRRHG